MNDLFAHTFSLCAHFHKYKKNYKGFSGGLVDHLSLLPNTTCFYTASITLLAEWVFSSSLKSWLASAADNMVLLTEVKAE